MNNLFFAVNQPNEMKLHELINQELAEKFNLANSEFVTHDFLKRMLDWLKEKYGTYITNKHIDNFYKKEHQKVSQFMSIGQTLDLTEKLRAFDIRC